MLDNRKVFPAPRMAEYCKSHCIAKSNQQIQCKCHQHPNVTLHRTRKKDTCVMWTQSHNKPAGREHGDRQASYYLVSKHTTELQDTDVLGTAQKQTQARGTEQWSQK